MHSWYGAVEASRLTKDRRAHGGNEITSRAIHSTLRLTLASCFGSPPIRMRSTGPARHAGTPAMRGTRDQEHPEVNKPDKSVATIVI